jgi:hypothetical protein
MLVALPDVEQPKVQDTTHRLQTVIAASRPNLSGAEPLKLEDLITEYGEIFATNSDYYGRTYRMYHRIDTEKARPIRQSPRRLQLATQAKVLLFSIVIPSGETESTWYCGHYSPILPAPYVRRW